jgi:hypothetical protein
MQQKEENKFRKTTEELTLNRNILHERMMICACVYVCACLRTWAVGTPRVKT